MTNFFYKVLPLSIPLYITIIQIHSYVQKLRSIHGPSHDNFIASMYKARSLIANAAIQVTI